MLHATIVFITILKYTNGIVSSFIIHSRTQSVWLQWWFLGDLSLLCLHRCLCQSSYTAQGRRTETSAPRLHFLLESSSSSLCLEIEIWFFWWKYSKTRLHRTRFYCINAYSEVSFIPCRIKTCHKLIGYDELRL